jgi:hypothetical protein
VTISARVLRSADSLYERDGIDHALVELTPWRGLGALATENPTA